MRFVNEQISERTAWTLLFAGQAMRHGSKWRFAPVSWWRKVTR